MFKTMFYVSLLTYITYPPGVQKLCQISYNNLFRFIVFLKLIKSEKLFYRVVLWSNSLFASWNDSITFPQIAHLTFAINIYKKAHNKSAYVILNTELWKQSVFKEI